MKILLPLSILILVGCTSIDVKCPENRIQSKEFSDILRNSCGTKNTSNITASGWIPKKLAWSHTDIVVYFYKQSKNLNSDQDIKDWLKAASAWESKTNIRFYVTENPDLSDIRVSFSCKGHWSCTGNSNENILKDRPTMNLEWRDVPDREAISIAKHEIGHAIGLGHEHNHPNANIQWDMPKVYEYYQVTQGWNKAQVDNNILKSYSGLITSSGYDQYSIMHYPIDPKLTLDGIGTVWNYQITERDYAVVNELYPKWKSKYNKSKTTLTDYNSRIILF